MNHGWQRMGVWCNVCTGQALALVVVGRCVSYGRGSVRNCGLWVGSQLRSRRICIPLVSLSASGELTRFSIISSGDQGTDQEPLGGDLVADPERAKRVEGWSCIPSV